MSKRFEEAATQHLIDTESHKYNMPSTIEFQIRAFLAGAQHGYAEGRRKVGEECIKLVEGFLYEIVDGVKYCLICKTFDCEECRDHLNKIRALVADEEKTVAKKKKQT